MAKSVHRWLACQWILGMLPLGISYLVHLYFEPRTPPLSAVLATGDAFVVAIGWTSVALLDLAATRRPAGGWGLAAIAVLVASMTAYLCLSADSVTGGVRTARQTAMLTVAAAVLLTAATVVGLAAAALAPAGEREER